MGQKKQYVPAVIGIVKFKYIDVLSSSDNVDYDIEHSWDNRWDSFFD